MGEASGLEVRVREFRGRRGWSQGELARRAGLSRAGVGAIETGRLVPSTAAALALAAALGCRVEDLFRLPGSAGGECEEGPAWAWPPRDATGRFWAAEVGGRVRLYPAEMTPMGVLPHDGVAPGDPPGAGFDPSATLVVVGCDPAVGLLAPGLARAGVRLLALARSSRAALDLLGRGLVHAAGVHLGRDDDPRANAGAVLAGAGPGCRLLRVARWDSGIAFAPALRLRSVRAALGAGVRWVGREEGSGARQCLDSLLEGRRAPRRIAADHRGVAEAVRLGWADAGVCLRLAGEEAGLGFLPVRREPYDLAFAAAQADDFRLRALVEAVRSPGYRRLLAALPGYDPAGAGVVRAAGC